MLRIKPEVTQSNEMDSNEMDSSPPSVSTSARLELRNTQSTAKKGPPMKLKRIGVNLTKNLFQVHGVDQREKVVWRKHLSRERSCVQ